MFKTARWLTLGCLVFISLCWSIKVLWLSASDIAEYQAISKQAKEVASSHNARPTKQQRFGARKDIWIAQSDGIRLHTRIESDHSTLALFPQDDRLDIIEELQQLRCWMQDKLYFQGKNPMQESRFFQAKNGSYQYTTQEFLAHSVDLSIFRLPGHVLSFTIPKEAAFLQGIAQGVKFAVSNQGPQFQADRFRAILQSADTSANKEIAP